MNKEQYQFLLTPSSAPNLIRVVDLINKKDRTLVYGYTLLRNTFHLYIKDKLFYRVVYDGVHNTAIQNEYSIIQADPIAAMSCVPNKRVYPERCDYEFCLLLQQRGVDIPFTTFDEKAAKLNKQYWGLLLEDLTLES